jgi:hypothetical protein
LNFVGSVSAPSPEHAAATSVSRAPVQRQNTTSSAPNASRDVAEIAAEHFGLATLFRFLPVTSMPRRRSEGIASWARGVLCARAEDALGLATPRRRFRVFLRALHLPRGNSAMRGEDDATAQTFGERDRPRRSSESP